jgi:competence protein ComEA
MDRDKVRLVGYAVAAVLVVLLGVRFLHGGSKDAGSGLAIDPAPRSSRSDGTGSGRSGGGASALVQVAGEVNRPGVYRVSRGARVEQAVERAGGLTRHADPAGINLVARVQDGQQVIVPRKGAAPVTAAGSGASGAATSGAAQAPISLSSASAAQLESLDGVGPTLAQRIVQYRQAHGGFRSLDELRQVQGIGEKRFEALRKAISP